MKIARVGISIFIIIVCWRPSLCADELNKIGASPLSKTTPYMAFNYFSGYIESVNNHPTIYAGGYKENAKVIVVGRGFYKEYSIKNIDKAFESYKALLIISGYEP